MRAEKGGSKSSGFFNLFDWNRKSRKKLFTISPEGSKIGRRIEEPLSSTRLRMMEEEEGSGVASIKGSSDYSCASSMTEEDLLNGSKPAGVVARLMGLDSLPASNISEPYSTPFRSFRETPLEYSARDPLTRKPIRNEPNNNNNNNNHYVKKMPSSPIERFQMEAIPSSRSAKSLPSTYHHKLLSPIKNPNFTYGRNASQIMEAAAKILEPRLEFNAGNIGIVNTREKVCSVGTSQVNLLRVSDPLRPEKASRLLQLSRADRYERGNNKEEDIVIFRPSEDLYEINNKNLINANGLNAKGNKGKSVSLALQAKVNVQKREGVNLSNRNNGTAHRETGATNQITGNSISGTSHQRSGMIKQQKKAITGSNSSSSVLRQNNQKQNCIGNRAGKSSAGKSNISQQGRKSGASETSVKQKSRFSSNLKPRKDNFELSTHSNESERDNSCNHSKDFPQKKRLIERNNSNVNNKKKNNVLVDEYTKWNKETKDTTDVVSFTFTSPLMKQTGGSSFGAEKLGLIPVKGNKDALSLLLENKLRELTAKTSDKSIDFGKSELDFCLKGKEIEKNGFEFGFDDALVEKEKPCAGGIFDFSNDQGFPVMEKGECSKINDTYEDEEVKQLSPFTVFGEESCSTSESSTSIDGSKASPSSIQAQNMASSRKPFSVESEAKLSRDSVCSETHDNSSKYFELVSPNVKSKTLNREEDYIIDIVYNTDLEKMGVEGSQLDSLLFDKLERKRSRTELERNDSASLSLSDRKLLYDCVNECLDSKLEVHFRAGFKEWNKGFFAWRKGIVHKEIHGEIEGWRNMSELNVDEIVERDMVTKMDYRADSIEIGTELEAEILDSLINEAVTMLLEGGGEVSL